MLSVYPQLADVAIDYGWGGTLAITMNRLPYFARVADNVLIAGGYSGQGIAMATLAGQILSWRASAADSGSVAMMKLLMGMVRSPRAVRRP